MKTIKVLLFVSILISTTLTIAQSFTYFPLSVGNKWFFASTGSGDILTIYEVISDTILSDGKVYSRIDASVKTDTGWTRCENSLFLRVENEVLYRFPSDTVLNFNWNDSTSFFELPEGFTEIHVGTSEIFNESRVTYYLYIYYPYEYVSYTDSIGWNALHALTWHDWTNLSRYLVGCIIDNQIYGRTITDVNLDIKNIQNYYELYQNFPNPFNPNTTIKYSIPVSTQVSLKVFDIIGSEVATLVNEQQEAGTFSINFDASKLTSGIYFYQIKAGNFIETKKFILIK